MFVSDSVVSGHRASVVPRYHRVLLTRSPPRNVFSIISKHRFAIYDQRSTLKFLFAKRKTHIARGESGHDLLGLVTSTPYQGCRDSTLLSGDSLSSRPTWTTRGIIKENYQALIVCSTVAAWYRVQNRNKHCETRVTYTFVLYLLSPSHCTCEKTRYSWFLSVFRSFSYEFFKSLRQSVYLTDRTMTATFGVIVANGDGYAGAASEGRSVYSVNRGELND